MKGLPVLSGSLVKLGAFTSNYVPVYHRWLKDDYVLRMTETSKSLTLRDVTNMQKDIEKDSQMAHFLIFDRRTDIAIGDIDLRDIKIGEQAEIAVMIAESAYRRGGYATEAYKLLLNFGFKKFNLKSIIAPILTFNTASIEFHKKLGFKQVGKEGRDLIFELSNKGEVLWFQIILKKKIENLDGGRN